MLRETAPILFIYGQQDIFIQKLNFNESRD